jgi:hypothetical protein
VLTAPGVPAMLQGSEWLESRDFGTDEGNRIDWGKKTQYAGVFALHRDLIELRTQRPELRADAFWQVSHLNEGGNVIGFRRGLGDGTLMVLVNFSNNTYSGYQIGVPLDTEWRVLLDSQDAAYGGSGALNPGVLQAQPGFYDGFGQSVQLEVPAMSILVLEKAPTSTGVGPITGPSSDAGTQLKLMPAAPNPASGVTVVRFRLPTQEAVRVTMHDVRGRRVRVLADDVFEAGEHSLTVDTRELANGTYFVRMRTLNTWRATKLTITE